MSSPLQAPALMCVGLLLCAMALSSLAMGSAASQQMAAKRRISLQLRQDMERCARPGAAGLEACQQQAREHAMLATAQLQTQRQARRQAHRQLQEARQENDASNCLALPRRLRRGCIGAVRALEKS